MAPKVITLCGESSYMSFSPIFIVCMVCITLETCISGSLNLSQPVWNLVMDTDVEYYKGFRYIMCQYYHVKENTLVN